MLAHWPLVRVVAECDLIPTGAGLLLDPRWCWRGGIGWVGNVIRAGAGSAHNLPTSLDLQPTLHPAPPPDRLPKPEMGVYPTHSPTTLL